ncbi:hypothetical protein AJ88_03880 [Mesorhizobium amorphae CCBAU 01583]|nr:hypothetical protein AJ88_03880 [Mesorhizobium amorphae CCBAU 01583]
MQSDLVRKRGDQDAAPAPAADEAPPASTGTDDGSQQTGFGGTDAPLGVNEPAPSRRTGARPAVDVAPQSDLPLTDQDFEDFQNRMSNASANEKAKARADAAAAEKKAKADYEARVAQHKRIRAVLSRGSGGASF